MGQERNGGWDSTRGRLLTRGCLLVAAVGVDE